MYIYIKEFLDRLLAIFMIIVLLPFIFSLLLLNWLLNGVSPIYRGLRVGKGGKQFYIFKIRTLKDGSFAGSQTTSRNDSRLLRMGKFLRKWKLDELPQLLNILSGSMSFVGPRPEISIYTDMYTIEERESLSVKPGLTDYASIVYRDLSEIVGEVNAHDAYLDKVFKNKNRLRMRYAREISLAVDLKIIVQTILAIFR
jgi:lipopolysaccharide/colanic/teichoic acid biosynthesis glycosyltransferase